jgi:hypothetical protein
LISEYRSAGESITGAINQLRDIEHEVPHYFHMYSTKLIMSHASHHLMSRDASAAVVNTKANDRWPVQRVTF